MDIPWKILRKLENDETNGIMLDTFNTLLVNKHVTKLGVITEKGYKLYLSLLAILGKNSVINEPPRKQYIWFTSVNNLIQLDLVKYDIVNYEYNLTSKGHVMLEVLARSLMHKGVPKI
jgi:hypothetical protein